MSFHVRLTALPAILMTCLVFGSACTGQTTIEPTAPSPHASTSQPVKHAPVLTASEAWKHVGEVRTVRYYVGNPYKSAKGNVFLNEKQDFKSGFTTVIFATIAPTFGDPLREFGYRTIEVSGLIRMYEDHPEIIINIPGDITIVQ